MVFSLRPQQQRDKMKYLKLLAVFMNSSLLVDLEYRANFIVQAIMGVFQTGITYISVALFFTHTDNLGGWTYEQSLIIVGLFSIINGVIYVFMQPNIKRIVEMVRDGDPDHPWAWVDLDIDPFTAWRLLRQLDRQYFAGSMMRWYIPAHQG